MSSNVQYNGFDNSVTTDSGYEVQNILTTKYYDTNSKEFKYTYTFKLKLPRKVLAELNKHRIISQSVGSSRAIPFKTHMWNTIKRGVPLQTSLANKGMIGKDIGKVRNKILASLSYVQLLLNAGISNIRHMLGEHKEQLNRTIEAWSWVEAIVTTSDWSNFLNQRLHGASLDIMPLAKCIKELLPIAEKSAKELKFGEWHIPGIKDIESSDTLTKILVSAKRMGRVSYYPFGTKDLNPNLDKARAVTDFLLPKPQHLVPFEHQRLFMPNMQYGFYQNMIPARYLINGVDYPQDTIYAVYLITDMNFPLNVGY